MFLNIVLNAKVIPKVVIYLCDEESFKFLFTIAMMSTFITKMKFEFGQYMVGTRKVLISFLSLMREPMLYYVYLFFKKVGKFMQVDIMGSKKFPLHIENVLSTFVEDGQLYRHEICSETFAKFLEPILCSDMVCLNIFGGSLVTYVCLVCLFICLNFYSFCILFIFKLIKSFFAQNARK